MNDAPNIDIERYITGHMSVSEIKEFEQRLNNDADLDTNYKTTLAAHKLIKEAGRLELKNKLDSFDSEIKTSKIIPLWVKRSLPIAALFVAFLGVYQFGGFSKNMSNSEVFTAHFETYTPPSIVRDANENRSSNWDIATQLYRERQFEAAIVHFDSVDRGIPQYLISFYSGISAMTMTEPNETVILKHFQRVLRTANDYHQQANWYKGLTLLRMNKRQEALTIFESIAESKSYNYKKAEEILDTNFKD